MAGIEQRGDVVATAKLFDLLLRLKADHPQYKNVGVQDSCFFVYLEELVNLRFHALKISK